MQPIDNHESKGPAPASSIERRLSLLITGVLVIIAAAMAFQQSRFDAAQWQERSPGPGGPPAAKPAAAPSADAGVDGLVPMSAAESYDARTLSDKINGKAELYLSAGFKGLKTRRFSLAGDSSRWLERYIYDMGRQRNAFAVYSGQRRRAAAPLEFVPHGFLASNGLFFVHGSHYVEIIAADATEQVQAKMKAMAAHFVKTHDAGEPELAVLDLFPPERLMDGTKVLIADSAFGLADLDWVYTALYQEGTAQATAFLRACASAAEARSLAAAFTGYWTEFGGEPVDLPEPDRLPDATAVTILDNFEIVLVQGNWMVGVHEATQLEFGVGIAARLLQMVKENARDQ